MAYFLSAEHLEHNAHARSLYKSNGERFYVKDFMSWPSMAGLTEMEVISVLESLTGGMDGEESSEIGLWIPTDSLEFTVETYPDSVSSDEEEINLEWWPSLLHGERASANLREVFAVSDRCNRLFKRSEAAIRSEL